MSAIAPSSEHEVHFQVCLPTGEHRITPGITCLLDTLLSQSCLPLQHMTHRTLIDFGTTHCPKTNTITHVTIGDSGVTYQRNSTTTTIIADDDDTSACHDNVRCYRKLVMEHSPTCPVAVKYRQFNHMGGHMMTSTTPSTISTPSPSPPLSMRLAVVILPHDPITDTLFMTRRAANLRGFPAAWVFPGGRVDAGESLETAGHRELYEETGLRVSALKPLCVWESVFPPKLEYGDIKALYMVVFFIGTITRENTSQSTSTSTIPSPVITTSTSMSTSTSSTSLIPSPPPVHCSADEVDRCIYLDHVLYSSSLLHHPYVEVDLGMGFIPASVPGFTVSKQGLTPQPISLHELCGVYPNQRASGVGEAHLFALGEFVQQKSSSVS